MRGEEDAIVAALAKSARASNDGNADMEVEGDGTDVPPQSRRPKFSINIFEDVDDRWVDAAKIFSLYHSFRTQSVFSY